MTPPRHPRPQPRHARGQSSVETLVLLVLVCAGLWGAGQSGVIPQALDLLQLGHARLQAALALP